MKDYEKLSKEHFNKQAPVYDQRNTPYYSAEGKISCQDIADILSNKDYTTLLDVGCGTGYLAELLTKKHEGDYYGIDLSDGMLKMAKSKQIPHTEFLLGKSDALPYPENLFDIVTCSQSFHHYPHQERAMKEAYRVLKVGGQYILSDTGIGGLGAWLDNHILFKLLHSGDFHVQNRHSIAAMMKQVGFTVISSRQVKGLIYTVVAQK